LYCQHFHTPRVLQERYAWFRKDHSLRSEPEVDPFRFGPNGLTGPEALEALRKAAGPFAFQAAGG